MAGVAFAAPVLTATPITWGVVGLDSNDVTDGPNTFASGARVCNTGTSAATNVTATYAWTTVNTYINLTGQNPLSLSTLAVGACYDFYFNIVVTRTSAAYDTARRFRVDVTADGLGTVSTPTPRELYVEHLVSQNRNGVDSVTGPTSVVVGNTYTYVLSAHTAPGGYEQLSSFLNLSNAVFQIVSVATTYTAPAGGTNNTIYGDACGWQPDPSLANYRSCVGPVNYSGGKVGGDIVTTYQVKILGTGSNMSVYGLIYDKSGGAYHYNNDYGNAAAGLTSITAVEQVDLSLTKTDSVDPVTAGNNLTYTMVATNAGPSTAHGVSITDAVPGGTTFVSADDGGSVSGGTVTWSLGDIATGSSSTVHLTVHVNSARTAALSNTASATTTTTDTNAANNSATQTTAVVTSANLSINKSDSPDPVGVGQDLTYTLAVSNAGPSDALGVSVSDTLPAGVTYVSATPTQGTCSQLAGVITCPLGTVVNGGTPSVTVVVRPTASGSIANTASVSSTTSDPASGNNSDTANTTVQPRADLSVTKGDSPDPVVAGNQVTYTMVVTNNGPSTAASTVLTDPLPGGTSFVSADGGGAESGGTVTWNLGSLATGATTTVHLVVAVNAGRTSGLSNTASVTSSVTDPDASNNSATQGTTVGTSADLSISKTDSPDPVVAGQNVTYTLSVGNAGPSDALAVSVTDVLPAGLTYVSATPSQGSCSQLAGTVTCSLGTVAPGATPTVAIVATATGSGSVTNTASVSSTTSDPSSANNSDTEDTAIAQRANLSIVKTDSPDPVYAGNDETYTLTVHNAGPSTASSVVVTDTVPAGTTFVFATPSTGTCGELAGVVTCSLGDIANGGTETVTLVVDVASSRTTDISNTASVSSSTIDPVPGNDSSTQSTTVQVRADVGISKTDGADPVAAGNNLTYTILVTDQGPSDATGVLLTDPIPAGTSFVSADGGGSLSGGTVSWNIGSMTSGSSQTFHVTVHVDPSRVADLSNTASVSSTTTDPNAVNDTATEPTAVAVTGDLSVTKTDGSATALAGGSTTYTITLQNLGASTVPAGAVVTDTIPAGTSGDETEANCDIFLGDLTCTTAAALAPGDSVSWQVSLDVPSGFGAATLSNTALLTSSPIADSDATNDADTDTDGIVCATDLSVTKSDSADPVTAGTDLTYTLVATNDGPSDATGVVVTDAVPVGTTFVSADGGGLEAAGTVTWNLGALSNGASTTVHVTVHVDSARTTGLSNTANIGGDEPDANSANDSATETTSVATSADLSITKTDDADPVTAGADLTYTMTVTNNGPSDATGVVVTDAIPAGTTFVSADNGGVESAGTVSWAVGALADGATSTLHVVVHVNAGRIADLSNTALVEGDQLDTDATNDSATESTAVSASADLSITKSDSADPATVGTDLTYTIVATNNGPSDATGVTITDPLPAGTTFVSADNGGVESVGTVSWSVGSLANGASKTLRVTVHVNAARTTDLSNTASVTGNEEDSDISDNSATETTAVAGAADLSITKTDSADPVTAGADLTYTIVVKNDGSSDASGVTVTDPVPTGTTFVSADNSGTESAGIVTWNVGALADGASTTLHVVVHVDAGRTADLSNTASVVGDQSDPDGTNDSATESTAVTTATDLSITKTDSADPATGGTDLTYTLVATNNGPSDATGVTVTDPIPAGTSFVSADNGGVEAGGTVTWTIGALTNGASNTLHVTVHVNAARTAELSNTATVIGNETDPDATNDDATEATSVQSDADASVSVSDALDPVAIGNDVTYSIVAANGGPSDASAVTVTNPVPAGASFVSATPSQGSCAQLAGIVTCALGTLAPGATATITLVVTATSVGTVTDTATVATTTTDSNAGNDTDSEETTVTPAADLRITKTDSADPATAGADLTYTLVVTNNGPADTTGVTVTDPIPAGASFVSADNGGTESAGTVTWAVGALTDGASVTLHVTVHVNPGRTMDLSNTASVIGDDGDPDSTNNSATETTAVTTSADLAITKTDDADPVLVGAPLTYTLTVTSNGPSDATGVVVTDPLPASMTFGSATPTTGSCAELLGTVSCSLGTMADGDTVTITIVVTPTAAAAGSRSNTASVTSDVTDPDPTNDSDTESTQVDPSVDLSLAKTDSADPATAGTDLTYTLVATNNGPSDASGVIVSDPLPAGTNFVSADNGGVESGGTVTWTLGALANGASSTLHVTVHVDAARTTGLTNTASVAGNETDTDSSDDTATETTAVATSADLSITKTDSADPATAGTDLTYTIMVTNDGPSDATGVVVTDPVPAGTTFVSSDNGGSESSGTVTWALGALANGASSTMHVVVHVDAARTTGLSNTASVAGNQTDPDSSNDSATAITTVATSADLAITKTDDADPVTAGTDLTYTMVVTDNGPSDASGVTLSDPLPAGTSFVSADNGGVESGGTVTWTVGSVANGASSTVHVTVHVDAGTIADLSNTATVTASTPDPDLSNDSAVQGTTVVPAAQSADLSITKSDDADPATAGAELVYTIDATNNGPSDATGVIVSDPLPTGTSFVSADNGGVESGGIVTWNVATLANGATATVHVTVLVNASRTQDLSNTASVAGDQADPDSSNDSATETTAVTGSADLQITKAAASTSVIGANLLYTITVTNNGPSDATGVSVSDPLPAGATFVAALPTQGTCGESAGTVSCDLGGLANGATATIVVTVAPTGGDLVNTASVTSDVADPNSANDTDTASTTITVGSTSANLSITKTGSPDPVYVGQNVTYTITVTNVGPDAAAGVTVTDPLDSRLAFVSADEGGTETAGVVTWDLEQLSNGAARVLTVVATVKSDHTPLVNTATVTSSTPDANSANDQDTAVLDPIDPSSIDTDLSVRKTVDRMDPAVGQTVAYSIEVRNGGPGDATGVKVSDHLPSGLAYVSSKADVGTYDDSTGIWLVGDLAAKSSATLYLKAMITKSAPGTSIDNTARIAGLNQNDTNNRNDSSQQDVTVTRVEGAGGSGGTAFTGAADVAAGAIAMLMLLVSGIALLIVGRRKERKDPS
jgi:uncharacterized repeat protein (TIGR01451 family)